MSVNKVILVGNVGRDPEVRYLDGGAQPGQGTKVATFTLATSERYRDRNSNELKENTEWHNIVAFRQPADVAEKFVRKGTQLYIEGRLRTRSYTDAQGAKKYTTEIVVDTLQLLGRRDDQGQGGYQGAPQGGFQQPAYQQQPAFQSAPRQQAPQPAYQQPSYQQPSYQAPVQQAAPQTQPIDLGVDDGSDDLPF